MVLDSIFDLYHLGYTLDFTFSSSPSTFKSYLPQSLTCDLKNEFLYNDPLTLKKSLNLGSDFTKPLGSFDMGLADTRSSSSTSNSSLLCDYAKNNIFDFTTNSINSNFNSSALLKNIFSEEIYRNPFNSKGVKDLLYPLNNKFFATSHISNPMGTSTLNNSIFATGFNTTSIIKLGEDYPFAPIKPNLFPNINNGFNTTSITKPGFFRPSDSINTNLFLNTNKIEDFKSRAKWNSLEELLDDLDNFPTSTIKSKYSILHDGGKFALEVFDKNKFTPIGILHDINKYMVDLKLTIQAIEKKQGGVCVDDPIYQALRKLERDITERQSDHERDKAMERINKRIRIT